jgi:hypothetical protein
MNEKNTRTFQGGIVGQSHLFDYLRKNGYICECPNCGSNSVINQSHINEFLTTGKMSRSEQLCESCLRDMRIDDLLNNLTL